MILLKEEKFNPRRFRKWQKLKLLKLKVQLEEMEYKERFNNLGIK